MLFMFIVGIQKDFSGNSFTLTGSTYRQRIYLGKSNRLFSVVGNEGSATTATDPVGLPIIAIIVQISMEFSCIYQRE